MLILILPPTPKQTNKRPRAKPSGAGKRVSKPLSVHQTVGADGEINANACVNVEEGEDAHLERADDDDDEYDDDDDEAAAKRFLAWLKLSAVSLMTVAGAYYVSRKMASKAALNGADWLAASTQQPMSGVEAQQLPARFGRDCVSCGLKSLKTVIGDNSQKNASLGAVKGSRHLHKAYAAGDDFAPPRVYHNYWAAGEFPSQYYSKSETIKNYRFTRMFGW